MRQRGARKWWHTTVQPPWVQQAVASREKPGGGCGLGEEVMVDVGGHDKLGGCGPGGEEAKVLYRGRGFST